jgi:hypothetical protein
VRVDADIVQGNPPGSAMNSFSRNFEGASTQEGTCFAKSPREHPVVVADAPATAHSELLPNARLEAHPGARR